MPRPIPASILRSLYSKNSDKSLLCALKIDADNEDPIFLVNNEVDVEYLGQIYTNARFTVVLPDDNDSAIPTSTIVFADIQNQFLDLVRNYDQIKIQVNIIAATVSGEIHLSQSMSDTTYITADATLYTADATIFNSDYTGNTPIEYKKDMTIETYDTKIGPYNMIMSNANGDASTATFSISIDDVGQYAFPKGTFNSTDFPGIY